LGNGSEVITSSSSSKQRENRGSKLVDLHIPQ
jgi:N6-adenosine-specific RNA methylase IME4